MNQDIDIKGQTVKIKESAKHFQVPTFGGSEIQIEDLWTNITGKSYSECEGNPACLVYALRCIECNLPTDDNVYYGKIGSLGHLVHISELEI
ncbi:MAG: hypothetical protein ACOC2W_00195 [bacterium]